jgi:hypothetical protein
MNERPFHDQTNKPNEESIRAILGSTFIYYNKVVGLASSYLQAWTFSKSSGWILKISDRKKALLYLIPLHNSFKISLTIREKEREAFLHDDELRIIHEKISSSKKYPEGYAMQFDIGNRNDFEPVDLLIRKIIIMRD